MQYSSGSSESSEEERSNGGNAVVVAQDQYVNKTLEEIAYENQSRWAAEIVQGIKGDQEGGKNVIINPFKDIFHNEYHLKSVFTIEKFLFYTYLNKPLKPIVQYFEIEIDEIFASFKYPFSFLLWKNCVDKDIEFSFNLFEQLKPWGAAAMKHPSNIISSCQVRLLPFPFIPLPSSPFRSFSFSFFLFLLFLPLNIPLVSSSELIGYNSNSFLLFLSLFPFPSHVIFSAFSHSSWVRETSYASYLIFLQYN